VEWPNLILVEGNGCYVRSNQCHQNTEEESETWTKNPETMFGDHLYDELYH
jgi:hypothetical protein